jgi:hypothetical protein
VPPALKVREELPAKREQPVVPRALKVQGELEVKPVPRAPRE